MGGSNFAVLGAIPDAINDGVHLAPITITGSVGTVVAAIAGKRIFVHGMHIAAAAAAAVTVQDVGASSTVAQSGPIPLGQGVPLVLPWQNYPYYTCAPGDALIFSLGSSVNLAGAIMYVQG